MPSIGETFARMAAEIGNSPTLPPTTGTTPPGDLRDSAGIERLQANIDGSVPPPPAWFTLGFKLVEVSPGRAVFELAPLPAHTSYGGNVHGGILASLADSAMGCAALSTLAAGQWCATLGMDVSYVRPATVNDDLVRAVGHVRHAGRSAAFTAATLSVGGREIAHASAVFAVRAARHLPGQPPA